MKGLFMVLWIKIAMVAVGLIVTSAVHFIWKGNAAEQTVDTVVEEVVDQFSGVDIKNMEMNLDSVEDALDGHNKN